jgi:3',5'-cyclic AMP phosphodiesterase CpdA
MTRIAHLTDLHLLEPHPDRRRGRERFRLSVLTMGRTIDADQPRRRFVFALREAALARADHLVISGDLTEDGMDAQFEVLAEVLSESAWAPDNVTIVPGNHDGYTDPNAWKRALAGPLAPYRRTSAPGAVTELRDATIVPTSTVIEQHWIRAAGRVGDAQCRRIADVLSHHDDRVVFLPMHHPPVPWGLRLRFLEGLLDVDRVRALIGGHENAVVQSGHTHHGGDHPLGLATVCVADAVVDHESPLRVYDASAGLIHSRGRSCRVTNPPPPRHATVTASQ